MKILFDSNVVLDIILARWPFVYRAVEITRLAIVGKLTCYLTASNITDVFYLAQKSLSTKDAKQAIINLMDIFGILTVRDVECRHALLSDNPDFEDALIEACAVTSGMDYIVTRDKKFLELSNRTISPEDLLAKIPDA